MNLLLATTANSSSRLLYNVVVVTLSIIFSTTISSTSSSRINVLAFTTTTSTTNTRLRPKAIKTTSLCMSSEGGNALIIQNKGGGHAELGYQLAKVLKENYSNKINTITILQDDACDDTKEPFVSYSSDLPDVRIVKAPLSAEDQSSLSTNEDIQTLLGSDNTYDYIWDNASKKPEGFSLSVPSCAKLDWKCKLYTYVSSAGMYQPTSDTKFPMDEETTPIKESAGQNLFDNYCKELGLPYVSFRPQYIYGPKSNKNDYIDWYFDRITSDNTLPIPDDGKQLVSLTNSEDVASLLASVLNDEDAAIKQCIFNCGTNNLVSYDDVAMLCSEIVGADNNKEAKIKHYDISKGKGKFPFRLENFYVSPNKAIDILKWDGPKHTLKDDLKWYYEGYKKRSQGKDLSDLSTTVDKDVLA